MVQKLKVLLIEDSEYDAALILEHLRQEGSFESVYERVDTAEAFKSAIFNKQWDIILADYNMPNFNGLSSLRILQKSGLDIPFILVSGSIGEDLAVAAMRAGAHDYILKDKLGRLVPAINRELEELAQRKARRLAEDELKISESRFRYIFDANIIGILFGNVHGELTEVNEYFLNMIGYTQEEFSTKKIRWKDITPADCLPRDERAIEEMLFHGGKATPYEKQYFHKDGHRVDALIGMALLEGSTEECVCCVLDLTDRKAKEAVEIVNLRKNQFLANMSHELRTPLHTIITGTSVLLEEMMGPLTEKQQEYLRLISKSGEHLLKIINDILDISKIEAGKDILTHTDISLKTLIEESVHLVRPLCEEKQQILNVTLEKDLPATIQGDMVRLKQALCNLLSNAHKFTPAQKQIHLRCYSNHQNELLISVQDEGPGIPKSDLELEGAEKGCDIFDGLK